MTPLLSASVGAVLLSGLPYILSGLLGFGGALTVPVLTKRLNRAHDTADTQLTQANLLQKLEEITTDQGAKLLAQAGEIADLKQELALIKHSLRTSELEKDTLRSENSALRGRVTVLETDLATEKAQVQRLTSALDAEQERNRTLDAEMKVLRADVGALRARVAKQDVVLLESHLVPVADEIKPAAWPVPEASAEEAL